MELLKRVLSLKKLNKRSISAYAPGNKDEEDWPCECRCGRKFQTLNDMKLHIRERHSFSPTFRGNCNEVVFADKISNSSLTFRSSPLGNIPVYPCTKCKKVFAFRQQLHMHTVNVHYLSSGGESQHLNTSIPFPSVFFNSGVNSTLNDRTSDELPQKKPPSIGGDLQEINS